MMIIVKIFLLSCCVSVAFGGGYTFCEPFYTNYYDFLESFFKSIEQRKQAIISDAQNFSFYSNASVVEAQLTSDNYYTFFINVTAQLSNLTTITVENVLNGTITQVPNPLDCVMGSFEIVNNMLHDLRNQVLNVGVVLTSPSPSPSQNCSDISQLFPMYSSQLQQILEKRNQLNQLDAESFAKFQASIIALNIAHNENQFLFMVTALADALNIDIEFAKELVSGHIFDG